MVVAERGMGYGLVRFDCPLQPPDSFGLSVPDRFCSTWHAVLQMAAQYRGQRFATHPNVLDIHEKPADRLSLGYPTIGAADSVTVDRIRRTPEIRKAMFQDTISLAAMADTLSLSPDYRVLRRLVPRSPYVPSVGQETRTGVLLDTETTGLDPRKDEIIELGMVKFDYLPDGRIAGVRDIFSAFNEPTGPISAEVTALTGITDEMVAGHRLDDAAVNAFIDDAAILIAHNSGFDRKFAERYWPIFEGKAWGCSATEIEWRKHGFAGAQLGYLLNGAGYFHHAHRAVDDCHALLEVLAFELPATGAPALAPLLETARKATVRVWAEQSPFELKDSLKKRGYRWNDGSDGRPKSWFIDVGEAALDAELHFLKAEIYLRDIEIPQQVLTAFTRFSARY
jgi:DNA polymerase-3 subunit epsilon